ncbi:tRNA(adenine(34)) deaminase, chloroplastic-like [Carya illinoinensis]|uniref:tRNA(adenine(34)) deaminase, chloroplastic-like n=1 Tax=Carya illinoinensis TaxID=32201 RepID=UPI001C72960F|nr:tRNA(adenine(34)) deaminase, chloroplastic-like [Carya illinoinensis]
MFIREMLLEAKKAADAWEVPVGAVLVKLGKIIARGCKLRTLYVTLEPCPICAGINILVWGAPNKLLGADGSWIRLFPDGVGNGTEVSDKPAAPVHPFHHKMTIRRGVGIRVCRFNAANLLAEEKEEREERRAPSPAFTSFSHTIH